MTTMAQYSSGSIYWWRGNVHTHFANPSFSSMALRSFLYRSTWDEINHGLNPNVDIAGLGLGLGKLLAHPSCVVCFRDDDCPFPGSPLEREPGSLSLRPSSEIRYSPWAASMLNGIGEKIRESTGGPAGGGKGSDGDDDGNGGGGGGDDEGDGEEEHFFLLPLLTLAFAAFNLGYCIAVWVKDGNTNNDFLRTGCGLFCLLVLAAIRLSNRTGIDAYILGLGTSVGVMVWAGERCFVKRESNPAGIVTLFAASMGVTFTASLYHNI